MLSNDKSGLLKALLGTLPGTMAAKLARAVEVDRLMDGAALPHTEILTGLRPVLRIDRPEHTPTPLRLFCRPFQDLLTNAPREKKQKAIIARSSLLPVWQWVSQLLIPAECAAYMIEAKSMILAQQYEEVAQRAAEFRQRASEAIIAALRDEKTRKAVRARLGGDLVMADAEEMALLLPAGCAVLRIQELMPRPVHALEDNLLWELRAVCDALMRDLPDAAPYVPAIAMNRLARPWEALKLPMMISRQTDDHLISRTDMGLVGEILMARMDGLQASIHATRHPAFDVEKLMEDVRGFAELSSGIVKEIEMRRDGEWGQRLLKDRATVGDVMAEFMDRAVKEVTAALPMKKSSADFNRRPDPEKHEMARRYARLVTGCRNFAAAASFGAKQKETYETLSAYLKRYNEDVVKELRHADALIRANVGVQFALCADLTALLFSAEEAELLRRRGRAAVGTEHAA